MSAWHSKHWRAALLLLAGVAIIVAGPASYYLIFNQWIDRTGGITPGLNEEAPGPNSNWGRSGLDWIETYNKGLSAADLALDTGTAFAFGCEWPRTAETPIEGTTPMAWVKPSLLSATAVLLTLLAMGALPWRRKGTNFGLKQEIAPSKLETRNSKLSPPPPLAWWRALLLLTAWVVLPVYGLFYVRSFPGFVSPWAWCRTAAGVLGWWWPAVLPGAAAVAHVAARRRWVGVACAIGVGLLLPAAVGAGFVAWRLPSDAWWAGAATGRPLWRALAIFGIATAWRGAGETTAERRGKLVRLLLVAAIVVGLCTAAYWGWAWAWEAVHRRHPKLVWQSIWFPRYLGILWPAMAIGMVALIMRLPTRPLRWAALALLLGLNIANSVARVVADTEPPWDRLARDVCDPRVAAKECRVVLAGHGARRGGKWLDPIWVRYYLCVASGQQPERGELFGGKFLKQFEVTSDPDAAKMRSIGADAGRCREVVVWERFPREMEISKTPDPAAALGAGWELAGEETWRARQARGWREGDWFRRRLFIRKAAATQAGLEK